MLVHELLKLTPPGPLLGNGSSGGSTTVTVSRPILKPKAVVMSFDPAKVGKTTFGSRKLNFTGGFTDPEKEAAKHAHGSLADEPINTRMVFHLTFTGSKSGEFVFSSFSHPPGKDKKPGPLDFHKIGEPTTSLPDSSKLTKIDSRLTKQNITLDGFSSSTESKVVKMALDSLTDDELAKMKDVRFSRSGSGASSDIGGEYRQSDHAVLIFNFGMEDAEKMVLGTDPADLLPNGSHAVIHESAHVIAYREIRELELEDQKKMKAYTDHLLSCERKYPGHVRVVRDDNGNVIGHEFDSASAVPEPQRDQYIKDVKELEKKHKEALAANKKYTSIDQSKVMKQFTKDTKSEPAVTPYSVKETAGATDDAGKRMAKEEVFAEAFSIYKWDKSWLGSNRPKMKSFFDAKKHLK